MTIDEEALRKAFAALQARVVYLERETGLFAPDASLDRPKGDPKVKFAPRDWRGPNFVGKNFSQCSPDFLEALASALSWAADNPQPGKEKYSAFNRKDGARARSWARRIRAKAEAAAPAASPPPPPTPAAPLTDEERSHLFDDGDDRSGVDHGFYDDEDDEALFPD